MLLETEWELENLAGAEWLIRDEEGMKGRGEKRNEEEAGRMSA